MLLSGDRAENKMKFLLSGSLYLVKSHCTCKPKRRFKHRKAKELVKSHSTAEIQAQALASIGECREHTAPCSQSWDGYLCFHLEQLAEMLTLLL